ncbi:MAG: hydrogenase maturation protease [Bryobacterales bacterium]|jgi:hydrogenase maturation protease|nr:hydrogenase maturation protease [Bryobacterales bacterium]
MPHMRIVGFGNLQRGDDAAGLLVAHRLREQHIPAQEASGDLLSLMTDWTPSEPVVLVDAAMADAPSGDILRFRAEDLPRHGRLLRFSTHGFGVADLVGMAGALGRLPHEVVILAIVGEHFGTGDHVSRAVLAAVDALVAEIAAVWREVEALPTLGVALDLARLCPPYDPALSRADPA